MPPRHRALQKLGVNVRRHRGRKKLTQERLAEAASLDPTYISGIERGVRNPSTLIVVRLAAALGTDASELFKGVRA